MSIPTRLMEDHCEAYGFWKENQVSDAICIHVDTHLDVMDQGFTEEILERTSTCQNGAELDAHKAPPLYPWGGIHCGNYLYPALVEGVVTHLIWVIPKYMNRTGKMLDFVYQELPNWVDVSLDEFASLRPDGPRVEGTLGGRRFTVCTSDTLPELESKTVLLDIDVDYYPDLKDVIQQTPGELKNELSLERIDYLTIAYSVDGGYTSLEYRYLGELTQEVFAGDKSEHWEEKAKAVVAADLARAEDDQAYQSLLEADEPDWFLAAIKLKDAIARGEDLETAVKLVQDLDPRYQYVDLNEGLVAFRKQEFERALSILSEADQSGFVVGLVGFQSGAFELALEAWTRLIEETTLPAKGEAYAYFMRGQCRLQIEETNEALADLQKCNKLHPGNYEYLVAEGVSLRLSGSDKKAAKSWRKALAVSADKLNSLSLHLELSRLYRDLGKSALADAELHRAYQKDTTGHSHMDIQMERLRAGSKKRALSLAQLPQAKPAPIMAIGGLS